jgi:hypothetical protein
MAIRTRLEAEDGSWCGNFLLRADESDGRNQSDGANDERPRTELHDTSWI